MTNYPIRAHALALLILLASHSVGMAQSVPGESKAVEAQIDAWFTSWNKHDFSDMANYMGKDCDFVNVAGMHWKGREDVQYAHQAIHREIFKDVPLEKIAVSIRFAKPDVAIAHVLMRPRKAFATPDGSKGGDSDALATFVFVKTNAVWLVEAVENVTVDEKAKAFNPVTLRNSSK
jgi:uncharacterized protein (TIGR02246 family)